MMLFSFFESKAFVASSKKNILGVMTCQDKTSHYVNNTFDDEGNRFKAEIERNNNGRQEERDIRRRYWPDPLCGQHGSF